MRASGLIAYAAGASASAEIGVAHFFAHFFLAQWRELM